MSTKYGVYSCRAPAPGAHTAGRASRSVRRKTRSRAAYPERGVRAAQHGHPVTAVPTKRKPGQPVRVRRAGRGRWSAWPCNRSTRTTAWPADSPGRHAAEWREIPILRHGHWTRLEVDLGEARAESTRGGRCSPTPTAGTGGWDTDEFLATAAGPDPARPRTWPRRPGSRSADRALDFGCGAGRLKQRLGRPRRHRSVGVDHPRSRWSDEAIRIKPLPGPGLLHVLRRPAAAVSNDESFELGGPA